MKYATKHLIIYFCLSIIFCACSKEKVPKEFYATNAHEVYLNSLKEAKLLTTALGKDWENASLKALNEPIHINTPYIEMLYIDSLTAFAEGYQFSVKEGQTVEFSIDFQGSDSTKIFMDAYRIYKNNRKRKIASSTNTIGKIQFTSHSNNDYVIRLQPELLRGGKCKVSILLNPLLDFPVEGKDMGAIQSFYGDPRDGGKRKHHGVDIFAKRHTPVYAPIDGYTGNVGKSEVGGLYVWMYNPANSITLYFAHLESQAVKPHTRIKKGDLLGTVGNSGNAKTTPPHLHFGIYGYRRVLNPYYYLQPTHTSPQNMAKSTALVGEWVLSNKSFSIDSITINKEDKLKILAATGTNYRVMNAIGQRLLIKHQYVTF